LVQQAIQLGVLPRLDVRQTSDERFGQVYVTQINWLLAVAVIGLVVGFRSSDALANAYGIAVAGDMLITSFLVAIVAHGVWKWPALIVIVVAGLFLILDATFVLANIHKIPGGGWFPLVVGAVSLTLMLSWRRGRAVALERREENAMPLETFIRSLSGPGSPQRVSGTAGAVPGAIDESSLLRRGRVRGARSVFRPPRPQHHGGDRGSGSEGSHDHRGDEDGAPRKDSSRAVARRRPAADCGRTSPQSITASSLVLDQTSGVERFQFLS
jgi:hypothetical protein